MAAREKTADGAATRSTKNRSPGRRSQLDESRSESAGAAAQPLETEIRIRAYELYEARGGEPGHELEDWCQAERELAGRQSSSS